MKNRAGFAAGLVIAVVGTVTLLGYLIWSGYREVIRGTEIVTRNYAAVLETRLDATLRRADADLQELAGMLPAAALSPDGVARHARALDATINARLIDFAEVAGIRVFDAGGVWLYPSGGDKATRLKPEIGDRDYFRVLRDNPQIRQVLSDVVIARSTGRQAVILARSVRDPQGMFRGVVVATIDLEVFRDLFKSLDVGASGAVAIYRSDNFKRVLRWPASAEAINAPLAPDSPTRLAMTARTRTATLGITAKTDGIERIYSYHALENFPLFVSVGIARHEAVADWRARSLSAGVIVLCLLALLIGLFYRMLRAESGLAERNAWFGATFEQAAVGMAMRALDSRNPRWLRVNQKLCDILGYTREELTRITSIDLTPPEDRAVADDINDRLARGEISNLAREKRYVHKNGKIIWTKITLSVICDEAGRPTHLMSVIEDISARKRSEQLQAYLAAIVEGSSDAIIGRTPERTIWSWNPAAERLFGYTANEVIGRSSLLIVPPECAHEAARNQELLAAGRPVTNLETVRLAKDGRRIHVAHSQSPIHDAAGTLVGVAMNFRDVTEQRCAREILRQTKESLAAIIDASMDAIVAVDADLRIVLFSKAAEQLFQISAAEAAGQPLERVIPARFCSGYAADMRQIAERGMPVGESAPCAEITALRPDGTEFPVEASIAHTANSGGQLLTVMRQDPP